MGVTHVFIVYFRS